MRRPKTKRLLRILCLAPVALVANLLLTIVIAYFVFVFDIYINTEKLSEVNSSLNSFCQNIADNPNFTKGPVIFRVDRGTLVYRLNLYFSEIGLGGYSPFFLFPHHRTVVLSEKELKRDNLVITTTVAHELGHIQGGLKHFGTVKEMESYANNFAAKITKTQPQKEPQK